MIAIYKNGALHPIDSLDLPEGASLKITVRDIPENESRKLEKQFADYSDKEVLKLAETTMPAKQDKRLSDLLNKQNEKELSTIEQKELQQLMKTNRLTTLKKAFALREISRRNLDGKH